MCLSSSVVWGGRNEARWVTMFGFQVFQHFFHALICHWLCRLKKKSKYKTEILFLHCCNTFKFNLVSVQWDPYITDPMHDHDYVSICSSPFMSPYTLPHCTHYKVDQSNLNAFQVSWNVTQINFHIEWNNPDSSVCRFSVLAAGNTSGEAHGVSRLQLSVSKVAAVQPDGPPSCTSPQAAPRSVQWLSHIGLWFGAALHSGT